MTISLLLALQRNFAVQDWDEDLPQITEITSDKIKSYPGAILPSDLQGTPRVVTPLAKDSPFFELLLTCSPPWIIFPVVYPAYSPISPIHPKRSISDSARPSFINASHLFQLYSMSILRGLNASTRHTQVKGLRAEQPNVDASRKILQKHAKQTARARLLYPGPSARLTLQKQSHLQQRFLNIPHVSPCLPPTHPRASPRQDPPPLIDDYQSLMSSPISTTAPVSSAPIAVRPIRLGCGYLFCV
ncbi:hypothetical protein BDP27DRAFT_1418402 [Rhodocollybia butyracea]|uniref:Uncharacterized protein n=1 Tax=Rhodocollybia butyracea TaxID=206335 RepID=A0A9P5PY52_9AGAR|nr:hypothetical protein BDP27DRAFT_1418402 [Rhodocollybia butyracea]